MKDLPRFGEGLTATLLGVGLAVLMLLGAPKLVVQAGEDVDLTLRIDAPKHISVDAPFIVNLAYRNLGSADSPEDTALTLTLPESVEFISATNGSGTPVPPDSIVGRVLTWNVGIVYADAGWQHIYISELPAEELPEETELENLAQITSSAVDINLEDNTASAISEVCWMSGSSKQAHARVVMPGDLITYTVTIHYSPSDGEMRHNRLIQFEDILPPAHQARFMGWTSPVSGTQEANQLRWQGEVPEDQPVQLQYRLGVEWDVVPGTKIVNHAQLGWNGGKLELDPAESEVILPDYARIVGPEGYSWQLQTGMRLDIPGQAVREQARFEYREILTGTEEVPEPPGLQFAHRAFELNAFQFGELHQVNQPITITIPYNQYQFRPGTLQLWFRERDGLPWELLDEAVSDQSGIATFTTDHFTEYALFGEEAFMQTLPLLRR